MKTQAFKPTVGRRASYFYTADQLWYDVKVTKITKSKVHFEYVDFPEHGEESDHVSEFEAPLLPTVADRFEYYNRTAELAFKKRLKSMVVLAQAGLGKSYILEQIRQSVGVDAAYVKGYCTPLSLYKTLYENQYGVIVFDDCDSVLEDGTSGNILKAVLDTTGDRIVSWKSAYVEKEGMPTEFAFQGTIIFLSNKPQDKMDQAVLSRSVVIDLYLTLDEMMERLEELSPRVESGLSTSERKQVFNLMYKYRHNIAGLSVRTMKLAFDVYEETADIGMTKYQLLCKKKKSVR